MKVSEIIRQDMKVSEIVQQIVAPGGGYCNGDPLPDGIDPKELVTLIAAMENKVDVWGELAIEWEEAIQVCDQEGYPVPTGETLAGHIQSMLARLRRAEEKAKPAPVRVPLPRIGAEILEVRNWSSAFNHIDLVAGQSQMSGAGFLAYNGVRDNHHLTLTIYPISQRLRIAFPERRDSWIEVPLPTFEQLITLARAVYGADYDIPVTRPAT